MSTGHTQTDLAACPFCGSDAELDSQFGREWYVSCTDEDCAVSTGILHTAPSEAIAAWNRRALPAPSSPQVPSEMPAVLFDGNAVFAEVTRKLGRSHCVSAHAVSATLDAVVRLMKAKRATPTSDALRDGWKPIDTAPKGQSVLLWCNENLPIYCGRQRVGNLGEPSQDTFAWRCDSSGRFANPTHWQPLPQQPNQEPQ